MLALGFGVFGRRLGIGVERGFGFEAFKDQLELVGVDLFRALAKEFRLQILELPLEVLAALPLLGVGVPLILQLGLERVQLALQIGDCRSRVDIALLARPNYLTIDISRSAGSGSCRLFFRYQERDSTQARSRPPRSRLRDSWVIVVAGSVVSQSQ